VTGYTLHVHTATDDGIYEREWTYDRAGADAHEAHDALVKRWRAAGYEFTQDKAALTLVRHVTDGPGADPRIGPHTDTIRYLPWEEGQ